MFSDADLKRLKEHIKDKTLDETVMTTGAKLHALLARLEAAKEALHPVVTEGGGK